MEGDRNTDRQGLPGVGYTLKVLIKGRDSYSSILVAIAAMRLAVVAMGYTVPFREKVACRKLNWLSKD